MTTETIDVVQHTAKHARHQRWWAFFWALLAAVLFSNKAILAKFMYREGIDALDIMVLRMVFVLPLFVGLLAWLSWRTPYRLNARQWRQVLFLGTMGYYVSSLLDFAGLNYISTGLERLVLFLTPSLVLLMSRFVFKKTVQREQWWAMALAYAGIVLVFVHEVQFAGAQVGLGVALVFGAAFSYAVYLMGVQSLIAAMGSLRVGTYALLVSSLLCLLHYTWVRDWSMFAQMLSDHPNLWGYSVVLAVLCTFTPVLLTLYAVSHLGSPIVSQLGMAGPISMLGLGYVFLGEPLTWTQVLGTALVLAGMTLVGKVATR